MSPIAVTKKEYRELIDMRKKIEAILKYAMLNRGLLFKDNSFGVLKNSFGKGSSARYVSKIRKSWRK